MVQTRRDFLKTTAAGAGVFGLPFLYAWNEYLYALLLLTGEDKIPIPVAMSNFLTTDNAPWNLLMAVFTVYSIPPVVLYYCFKRYLVSGLVSGAVSGNWPDGHPRSGLECAR